MRLTPIEQYVRGKKEFKRVLNFFKAFNTLREQIFVTEDYEEAIQVLIEAELRDFYRNMTAGFCYKENGRTIIAIDKNVSEYYRLGKLSVFIHELAHSTYIDDYMGPRNEEWAYNVQHYIENIITIEQQTGKKIRRNPLRVLRFPLRKIIQRIQRFTRKRIVKEHRETIMTIVKNVNVNVEGTIEELIEILKLINTILNYFLSKKQYRLTRKFLTYLLYMK